MPNNDLISRAAALNALLMSKDYRDAHDALEQLPAVDAVPTVNGWIRVKDRLPEENGIYLVCVTLGYMDFYTWSDKMWFSSAYNVCDDGFVTYWMPLPEPPKEDDDDAGQ